MTFPVSTHSPMEMKLAVPDLRFLMKPLPPIPLPYINKAFTMLAPPIILNVFISSFPVAVVTTKTPVSLELGPPLPPGKGVVAGKGPFGKAARVTFSTILFFNGIPGNKMTDITNQSNQNAIGFIASALPLPVYTAA